MVSVQKETTKIWWKTVIKIKWTILIDEKIQCFMNFFLFLIKNVCGGTKIQINFLWVANIIIRLETNFFSESSECIKLWNVFFITSNFTSTHNFNAFDFVQICFYIVWVWMIHLWFCLMNGIWVLRILIPIVIRNMCTIILKNYLILKKKSHDESNTRQI